MITSELKGDAHTVIPEAVRNALKLGDGDEIAYRIEDDHVVLTKVRARLDDPFVTFREWDSEADRRGYDGL